MARTVQEDVIERLRQVDDQAAKAERAREDGGEQGRGGMSPSDRASLSQTTHTPQAQNTPEGPLLEILGPDLSGPSPVLTLGEPSRIGPLAEEALKRERFRRWLP